MSNFAFTTVHKVLCGEGTLAQINDELNSLSVTRPLIVTDQGIVSAGLLDQLYAAVNLDVEVFADVVADPPEEIVLRAAAVAETHQADGIIGFGGGSSLDTAKVIARLACQQQPENQQSLQDMYGVDCVKGQRLPLVLIPTTAGTGSEATPVAVITTGETTKAGVVSSTLLPDVAILDATLTAGLPKHVTAATGIDAMVHAIEAITSKIKRNPYSDMLAIQALGLLSRNIETACNEPDNLTARQDMLLGAFIAGQAFANAPVAGVHALAYPLGGHFHIPHGLSNALVLPHVLKFNASAAHADYQRIAEVVGITCGQAQAGIALAEYFYTLSGKLSLPQTLEQCGVTEKDIDILASDAMLQTRLLVNNPRDIALDDAKTIYTQALRGEAV
ncbi:iron-containing alcohol dehydrogenase [Aestuariibacter salexigens]|uniref:iron-containing alcohol dehydrogenase n=1 Tax=Aestuariibacter salexigens TaxID=226010 RepID=UPI00041D5A02|nr:iron-containing alcohol dehydrogenase [Aestuariibacter salexigens]